MNDESKLIKWTIYEQKERVDEWNKNGRMDEWRKQWRKGDLNKEGWMKGRINKITMTGWMNKGGRWIKERWKDERIK